MGDKRGRSFWNLIVNPDPWKVESGLAAIFLVLLVVMMSGLEAAYVQVATTNRLVSPELLDDHSFLLLLALDLLVPLTVALLSHRAFFIYLIGQCFLSVILLHYTIFFYNTLTLSTIYHSMQGAASLGIDIFGFARWKIIILMGFFLLIKLFIARISMVPRARMPKAFTFRRISAVACMTLIAWLVLIIYGKTGLSHTWVDIKGHRTAVERRLEEGARESVKSIGYVATWLGEFLSGTYKDTALIFAEARCSDPDGGACRDGTAEEAGRRWRSLPLPELPETVIMIQVESLDYDVLDMRVNNTVVAPFLSDLARRSLLLDVFAPHKVGSCNSDYELLNGRIAEQNVVYYTYIKDYPDSVIHLLNKRNYAPAFFHGLEGSLFNLREAYDLQGFGALHFKEELLTEGYQASSLIMEHIRDEDIFQSAARALEGKQGPQAEFIVTMSSHVPFLKASEPFKSAGGSFARYVSSINYLDACLAEFYRNLPEKTLLIIWGDHGSDVSYPRGFGPGRRQVPFIVHVKGHSDWLDDYRRSRQPGNQAVQSSAAEPRVYTLCELHYYLRCLFGGVGDGSTAVQD